MMAGHNDCGFKLASSDPPMKLSWIAAVPTEAERARLRAEQCDVVTEIIGRYNSDAVVCVGVPFGRTRPQWILPHGGIVMVDGAARRVTADYS